MQGNCRTPSNFPLSAPHPPCGSAVGTSNQYGAVPPAASTGAAQGVPAASVPIFPFSYPVNKDTEKLSRAAESKLENVPRETSEYVQVMLHLGAMDVVSVRKLRNEDVDMAFAIAVSGVVGKKTLLKVLHGTNVESINSIVQEGFKVGGEEVKVRNGTAVGKGIYLTKDPRMASGYARCNYLLLCELCGEDKCITNGTVYVQPDKGLVRPLYVVEFRHPIVQPVNPGFPGMTNPFANASAQPTAPSHANASAQPTTPSNANVGAQSTAPSNVNPIAQPFGPSPTYGGSHQQ